MISTRNYLGKMFQKLLALQGASLSILAKFFYSYYNFITSSYYTGKFSKTLTKVLSYVVCIQSRRHVEKENTAKDISKKS